MKLIKQFWPWLALLVAVVLAARSMLFTPGLYYNMHDDLQMMRQLEMEKCFADGQIPCRWVPDMGYGFGFPLFNFYPPLPYLIGEVVRLFGFSFVSTAKILFALSFLISGVGMYLLAHRFFGKFGGVLAAIFYIWAPYHAVDVFVRGAMNEAWGLAWFPFILWAGYALAVERKRLVRWVIVLALAWFALLTSHNLMVLIFGPVFGIWMLMWLWQSGNWKRIWHFMAAGTISVGLAAFFTLPALFENSLTQISGQLIGYYDYTAHFVDLRQLFVSRFWGDGPSVWGTIDDGMSFQVGHVHWLGALVTIALIFNAFGLRKDLKRIPEYLRKNPATLASLYLLVVALVALFMTHTRSTFIWKLVPQLGYLQFPWRFLTLAIFGTSFAFGLLATFFKNQQQLAYFVGVVSIGLIAFNWNYFKPVWMGPVSDQQKFSDVAWDLQQTAGIYDYLPKTAVTAPKAPQTTLGEVMQGDAVVTNEHQGTNWGEFDIVVASESAQVRLGIFAFPDWVVMVDDQSTPNYLAADEMWGRMYIDVPQGTHRVRAQLQNTPIRSVSNWISLISWVGLASFPLWKRKAKIAA